MTDLEDSYSATINSTIETEIVELHRDLEPCEPEEIIRIKHLMCALLHDLIMDLAGRGVVYAWNSLEYAESQRQTHKQKALNYVFSGDPDDLYSLEYVCSTLGMDVEWFRNKVRDGACAQWAEDIVRTTKGRALAMDHRQSQRIIKRGRERRAAIRARRKSTTTQVESQNPQPGLQASADSSSPCFSGLLLT
jgi:hypothetical protein